MKILSEVGSLVRSLQSNKILQKISKKKDQGFYKTELQYREALKNNLIDLTALQDEPLYAPEFYSPGIAYSEILNSNIENIALDLEVVFNEINFLFSKIKSHEVFFERTINEVEVLMKKLEQTIETTKIEASADNTFNKIFHNTFIDASNKVDFTNIVAKEVYYDSILEQRITFDQLCFIDTKQGKLVLPKISGKKVNISEARILTTESTVSDYNISFPGNNISNILNSSNIQSWSHSILTKKALSEPAKLVLVLDFGDLKELNGITINPNSSEPIYLDDIYTIDDFGVKHSLDISKGIIAEMQTFLFKRLLTKAVYLVFKQDQNRIIPHNPLEPISLAELQRDSTLPLNIDAITGQIQECIKDPSIKNILGLNSKRLADSELVYLYSFSIASVEATNDDYRNIGIYVSKKEEFTNLRNLGLYVKDFIPTATHWQSGLEMLAGSIEYNIIKKNYGSNGLLISNSIIPILPIGTSFISNERLYFEKSKDATLRFRAHGTDGDGSNVEIYRNGELLIRGVDWKFLNRQSTSVADPMIQLATNLTTIELMHTADQIYNGVYWAKYTPRFISEPEAVIFDNGVRFLENCSIIIPNTIYGQEVTKSEVYVQIVIRNHTDSSTFSPYIDYYRLAGKEE